MDLKNISIDEIHNLSHWRTYKFVRFTYFIIFPIGELQILFCWWTSKFGPSNGKIILFHQQTVNFSIYEQIILSFGKLSNFLFVEWKNVLQWTTKYSHHWNTKCTSTNYKVHFNELRNALHRWLQNLSHLWTSKFSSVEVKLFFIVELINLASPN